MAVDPATQFQQAGLNIPYSYQPVETRLNPPIQLPETGALWAKVGETAMNAAAGVQKAIMSSRLNPEVKAQMDYAVQNYKRGQEIIDYHRKLGEKGFLLGRATPGGSEELSPAESGAAFAPLFQPKIPPPPGKEPPPAPEHAPGTGKEPQEQTTSPSEKNDLEKGPVPTASADTGGGDLAASTGNDFLLRRMMQERQGGSGAAPQGTPSSLTFLNPATGNIEPRMFVGPTTTPPPAAPAQQAAQGPQMTLGATAQPPPGMELAGTEQAFPQQPPQPDQATLAAWQAQNAHPVMASSDALNWAKNFDTGAQRATYLQHGGPNGEPAFAFHMKGGGINTVPISQIVKYGGGPSVAGQNTSAMLSTSDRLTNQPPGQPPGMTLGATAQAPPGMELGQGQPGQPPAAPEAYNAAAYQMPQGPTITQTGEVNPALMAGGSNEQMLAASQAAAAPPPTVPPPRTDITPLADDERAIATPEAIAAARANAKPDPNKPANQGDPYMGELGPWHLYRDDRNRTNELYAVRQGLSSLYKQQRYILGSDGWREYELPDTNTRLNMEAEFGGGKGGAVGAVMPDGMTFRGKNTFPSMSHDDIINLSVPGMQKWLDAAGKYHNTSGDANSVLQGRLSDLVDSSQRVQRMIDANTVALQEPKDPKEYNRDAQYRSAEARARDAILPAGGYTQPRWWDPAAIVIGPGEVGNRLQVGWHDLMAQGTPVNNFSEYLEEQVRRMNDSMSETPGRQAAIVAPKQQREGPSATIYGPWGTGVKLQAGQPDTSSVSPHMQVNKQFEAKNPQDQKNAITGLQNVKREYDRQFIESYEDALTHGFRLPPQATLYYRAITDGKGNLREGGKFPDPDNQFRDNTGQLVNRYRSTSPSAPNTPSASPTPTPALPRIATYDTKEFDRLGIKKGDQYLGPDGETTYTRGQ
jgi:hypothetical protein